MKNKKTFFIFIFFIFFYSLQLIISLFYKNSAPTYDLFVASSIIILFFFLSFKKDLSPVVPFFLGIGFLPHIIGLYKILPGASTLYGLDILNYHYDLIVHSFATLCYTFVVCSIFYKQMKKGLKSSILTAMFILFIMTGFGAFNEMLEYVGYDFLGYGEGFLEFGEGDGLHSGGPWENSSLDMLSNLLGTLIALFIWNYKDITKTLNRIE